MSAASRNDMVGLQSLQDSLVEQIGDVAKLGTRRRTVRAEMARLHAQGVILEDAAAELGITARNASVVASQLKLKFKTSTQRQREQRNEIIRISYAQNLPIAEIARAVGMTVECLKVTACRLGITRSPTAAMDFRRGFSIPDHLKEDYRVLKQRGRYRSREAGIALGLLEA